MHKNIQKGIINFKVLKEFILTLLKKLSKFKNAKKDCDHAIFSDQNKAHILI